MILFTLFISCLLVQIVYWVFMFSRVAFSREKRNGDDANYPISVVICGYNEGDNFRQFLPKIMEQQYPNFEVIAVNDRSTDDSELVLKQLAAKYSNLRILNLTDFERQQRGKKFALTQGLKAAKHEVVLLTDADCYPRSNRWIQTMANALKMGKTMGIAYAPFDKRPTFLNRFLRYDKIYIAIQYLSFALAGLPYMGVGPNLIYRKQLFFQSNGFKKHEHVASGDDDLFVSAVSNKDNLAVVLDENSLIYCEPKETFRAFYHQKSRHLSTSWHYKTHHLLLLGLLAQSHFWLYFFAVGTVWVGFYPFFVLLGMLCRWVVMMFIFKNIAHRFDEKDMTVWLPIMDFLYIFYYLLFSFPLIKGNNNRWE